MASTKAEASPYLQLGFDSFMYGNENNNKSNNKSDKTKKPLARSAIRSADPNHGDIPNLREKFQEDTLNEPEPGIVDLENILDDEGIMSSSREYLTPPSAQAQPPPVGVRNCEHIINMSQNGKLYI